jgi:RHS repeat-associated protein
VDEILGRRETRTGFGTLGTHRYLYGAAVDEILASESPLPPGEGQGEGPILWGLSDHEGTIRDVVDNATRAVVDHRVYDSFGNVTAETAPATDFVFGYTGQALDKTTGLLDYSHRWYDPAVGRFASEDPSGLASDANLYRYVGNDPWNNTDPTGLCGTSLLGAMGSAFSSIGSGIYSGLSGFAGNAYSPYSSTVSNIYATASNVYNTGLTAWKDAQREAELQSLFDQLIDLPTSTVKGVGWSGEPGVSTGSQRQLSPAWEATKTMGRGGLQLGADTVNGTTDLLIDIPNACNRLWNGVATLGNTAMEYVGPGWVPGYAGGEYFPLVDYIPKPEFSHNRFLPMSSEMHEASKQTLGILASAGLGELAAAGRASQFTEVGNASRTVAQSETSGLNMLLAPVRGQDRALLVEQPRDVLGRFAPKVGGEVAPGSIAESATWDAIANKPGWTVTPGRIYVRDATGQVRVYDGYATSPSGRNIGLEVKSGTGKLRPEQRAFDTRLNSNRFNKATGIGQHRGLEIDRAVEIRR